MSTALDELRELITPCAGCGALYWDTDSAVNEFLASLRRLQLSNPGSYEHVLGIHWFCAKCMLDQERINAERSKREAVRKLRYRLKTPQHIDKHEHQALISEHLLGETFDSSDKAIEARNPHVWPAVRHYPLESNYWLHGPKGTGKSYAAHCVLNAYIDELQEAAELSAMHLHDIGRAFNREARLQPYIDAVVLHLEDVDKPQWSSEAVEALWILIDKRHQRGGHLVVTSNAEPQAVSAAWKAGHSNPTVADTILERMLPMARLCVEGNSLRRAG